MIDLTVREEHHVRQSSAVGVAGDWKAILRGELDEAIVRGAGRWSRAIVAVACIHLGAFAVCQLLQSSSHRGDPRHILVWLSELAAVIAAMRLLAGKGWFWSPQAVHLVVRMWLTFLILSFSLATLNALIGWESHWYKAAWGTLSSFFFATLAWLLTPRFLILAVWMYLSALFMARFGEWNNLIYGGSWFLALLVLAWRVRMRERSTGRSYAGN
jgi:hypothetical protein